MASARDVILTSADLLVLHRSPHSKQSREAAKPLAAMGKLEKQNFADAREFFLLLNLRSLCMLHREIRDPQNSERLTAAIEHVRDVVRALAPRAARPARYNPGVD